jgi:hypothetical protein
MGRFAQEGNGGGDFEAAPVGNHAARCIRIIDLGTQTGEYQGKTTRRNQVMVMWELPDEPMADGKPFTVSRFYTNSLHEKSTLRADLISWRGRDFTGEELQRFDLQSILGAPCLVNVVHSESGKAKVTSVAKLPKGMTISGAVNPPMAFWLDEFDAEVFESLGKGLQAIIAKSPEYQSAVSRQPEMATAGGGDDDIPFANPYRGRICLAI